MVLAKLIISLLVGIISILINKLTRIVSIVSIIAGIMTIIIHGSAPLKQQEILGMPTMYQKPNCNIICLLCLL